MTDSNGPPRMHQLIDEPQGLETFTEMVSLLLFYL